MMTTLCTDLLSKEYRSGSLVIPALSRVSLSVGVGEFVGVMGPSGSGKTTLLNLLSGIDKPTSGSITIRGDPIEALDDESMALFRRRIMGFVFQDYALLDNLTIRENILVPMALEQKDPKFSSYRARQLMETMGIFGIAAKYPYQTSGGEQQRTAIARALANEPAIILADEPTGNLDSKSSGNIMRCFERLNEDEGATILMVTHDPFAASFCSRIIFLADGQVEDELVRECPQKQFYDELLLHLAQAGGDVQ